ncbi:MAG TPA: hypothetical protein VF735_03240 [Pyrinomonadaceae bacterium]|jgi:hypothetical protein
MFIETVKVKHPTEPDDFTIINKSDFNPDLHTLFEEKSETAGTAPDTLEQMKRPQLAEVAARYDVKITPGMSNVQVIAAIKASAGYASSQPEGAGEGQ